MTVWPLDDKDYTAESIGAFAGTRTRGVYSADDCFRVTAAGGFNIKLSPGLAWLKKDTFWGLAVLETGETSFSVEVGSGQLSRYVAVCVLLDKTANDARVELRYGEYSDHPVKPAPRRDAYFDELIVATILQKPAQVEISASDIYDERMNEDLCGLMRDGVTGLPTSGIHAQAEALLRTIQDELADIEGGVAFDMKPVRVHDVKIAPGLFKSYTPSGVEEKGLHNDLGYEYKAQVPVSGVLESMTPYVTFSLPSLDKAGVGIANQLSCYNGGIVLYADGKPEAEITALTVECRKAVG